MKIVHWSLKNGSGLHRMAEDIAECEKASGIDSALLDGDNPADVLLGAGADIHVIHGHLPGVYDGPETKKVFVAHGTPESCFISSLNDSALGHGASDAFMQTLYRVKTSDAVATFWPRHREIWQSMVDRGRTVDLIPMGVPKEKWQRPQSKGKWVGSPSLLTAENCHPIKWPLDLFIALGWVMQNMREVRLHCLCLPLDQQRWWTALSFANGAAYRSYMSACSFAPEALLNAFASVDYYVNLVRYGDYNRVGLEAHAAGCPVISYIGNDYADYWIDEGDQRTMAAQLQMILRGDVAKRETPETPDIAETAAALAKIYERLL